MSKNSIRNHSAKPVFDFSAQANASRMPAWIRQSLGSSSEYAKTSRTVHGNTLHTVCEEAHCPNIGECWSHGTATFMILGDTCTRACGFCAVKTGRPDWFDEHEPQRVADAAIEMNLDYVVITCVNRDDLKDGGASVFADTIVVLRQARSDMGIELLTSDFYQCQDQAVEIIMQGLAQVHNETLNPQMVWGHNVETVPALYKTVRKGSDYQRTLSLLEKVVVQDGVEAKSAIMLGIGEERKQVLEVFRDLRSMGVQRIAIGQYLRPSRYHLPVKRYLSPLEFDAYGKEARAAGFSWVKAGPMVRSSYHAEDKQS